MMGIQADYKTVVETNSDCLRLGLKPLAGIGGFIDNVSDEVQTKACLRMIRGYAS